MAEWIRGEKVKVPTSGGLFLTWYKFQCSGCGKICVRQKNYGQKYENGCRKCSPLCLKFEGNERAVSRLWSAHKSSAKIRGHSQELTFEQWYRMSLGNCYYCGNTPSTVNRHRGHTFVRNGIDRVVNSRGYSVDNCVSCCWTCNELKGSRDEDVFLNSIVSIYSNLFGEK